MDITHTIALTEVEGVCLCSFTHCNPLKGHIILYMPKSSLQSYSALLIKSTCQNLPCKVILHY